jgi:hypothetical protein
MYFSFCYFFFLNSGTDPLPGFVHFVLTFAILNYFGHWLSYFKMNNNGPNLSYVEFFSKSRGVGAECQFLSLKHKFYMFAY